jgi:cytochrome b
MGDNSDPLPTVHNALFAAIVVIIIVVIATVVIYARRRRKRASEAALRMETGTSMARPPL